MLLGSHVSMSGKKMLLGSAEEAASYGSTTFMIYTGAPQNTRRKPIEEMNIEAGQAFMKEHNLSNIVVHAPYIINLGNTIKTENFGFAVDFLRQEIERAQALGATQITLHPGAHVGAGPEAGIKQIVKGLVEFDKIIGLDRLKVIHVNDSKNPMGSHKDRHANIGFGTIGFEALNGVVHHEKLTALPKILETPYVGEDKKNKKAPYGFEIAMLKNQTFDPELLEKIQGQN
ncbi:TPA: deoxyribonuclease IV [Enterococcus faecalis]|nr:deoxyribonuclease IV [Enterococcus faecalis]